MKKFKAGYMFEVSTWENDADHRMTETVASQKIKQSQSMPTLKSSRNLTGKVGSATSMIRHLTK